MVTFTREMIEKGFEQGLINLILSPYDDGIVCKIGNGTNSNWFYFDGVNAEGYNSVKKYTEDIPHDDIVSEIVTTLNNFHAIDKDEQLFYYYILKPSIAIFIHDTSDNYDYWLSEEMKELIKTNINDLLNGKIISNVYMEGKRKKLYLSSKGHLILENEKEE